MIYFTDGTHAYEGQINRLKSNETSTYNILDNYLKDNDFEYSSVPAFYEDIPYLSLEELNLNIALYEAFYQQMKMPKTVFWNNVKQKQNAYFYARSKLRRITLQAYTRPSILWDFDVPLNSMAYHYRSLVFSNDSIKMADAVCDLQEIYFDEFRDEIYHLDKIRYYLISLGWWHEAQLYLPERIDKQKIFEEFKKLLRKVKITTQD